MRIKAKQIIDKLKELKGKRNVNPIKKITEETDRPHISTAPQHIQDKHDKMMDRGDHPEQAAKKLGYTTLDRNVNTKPNK